LKLESKHKKNHSWKIVIVAVLIVAHDGIGLDWLPQKCYIRQMLFNWNGFSWISLFWQNPTLFRGFPRWRWPTAHVQLICYWGGRLPTLFLWCWALASNSGDVYL